MHTRRKIRDAVYNLLKTQPALTRMFEARTKPANEADLPFGNVTTGAETVEDLADQFKELRTLQVSVMLVVRQAAGVADKLDDLAETVEALLGAAQTLGGVCDFFRYKGCEPDYGSAAADEVAMLTMNYECKYTWELEPVLGGLSTVAVSFDMSGPRNDPQLPAQPDGQIDAAATINLPQ